MEKGIEIVRRTLVFCLWICGVGIGIFLVGLGIWCLIDMLFIGAGNYDGWWVPFVMALCGVIALVVTFLLHVMINWIFQVDE